MQHWAAHTADGNLSHPRLTWDTGTWGWFGYSPVTFCIAACRVLSTQWAQQAQSIWKQRCVGAGPQSAFRAPGPRALPSSFLGERAAVALRPPQVPAGGCKIPLLRGGEAEVTGAVAARRVASSGTAVPVLVRKSRSRSKGSAREQCHQVPSSPGRLKAGRTGCGSPNGSGKTPAGTEVSSGWRQGRIRRGRELRTRSAFGSEALDLAAGGGSGGGVR